MVTVLVPWKGGCPYREAAWEWVKRRYTVRVVLAECPTEEWCKAAAVEEGLRSVPSGDLIVADADVWCDTLPDAIKALETHEWAVPHRQIRRLSAAATRAVLTEGIELGKVWNDLDEPAYRVHLGGGIVALRRETYERIPLDPRFVGWGHEDQAFGYALRTLAGEPARFNGALYHLWHPPQPRPSRMFGSEESVALYHRYEKAYGKQDEMRSLLDEVADDCRAG